MRPQRAIVNYYGIVFSSHPGRFIVLKKLGIIWSQETGGLHIRLLFARLLLSLLPDFVGGRFRSPILQFVGFKIGKGTIMAGMPTFIGAGNIYQKLKIGQTCFFNTGCFLDLSDEIIIGDNVSLGQSVMLLTHTHEIGDHRRRAAQLIGKPIHIQSGVWLGARSTILPGVTIYQGAIVAAGAVVTKDVEANSVVGGVPAAKIRQLD